MGQPDHEAELIAVARPFWDAEAEITRRFFAGKPGREHYLRYLKAAVYKELNPVIGYGATTGYAHKMRTFHIIRLRTKSRMSTLFPFIPLSTKGL